MFVVEYILTIRHVTLQICWKFALSTRKPFVFAIVAQHTITWDIFLGQNSPRFLHITTHVKHGYCLKRWLLSITMYKMFSYEFVKFSLLLTQLLKQPEWQLVILDLCSGLCRIILLQWHCIDCIICWYLILWNILLVSQDIRTCFFAGSNKLLFLQSLCHWILPSKLHHCHDE